MIMICCLAYPVTAKEFLIGADISALTTLEQNGAAYLDKGRTGELIAILRNNGFNSIRLRIFVDPNGRHGAVNDLPYTIELAKRAKAGGMKLLLNFHYSDTWADPQQQTKPKAWENMPFEELKQTVQSYTASVMEAFKKENVVPDIVQVGNEITPGMLWPDGKISEKYDTEAQWEKFTSLLKAGIAGVRSVVPDPNLKIMIHIDQGGKKSVSQWFFGNLNKYDVPFDIVGVSYYPWWHGTVKNLKENLNYIAKELKKDVMVVEVAYPHTDKVDWHGHPPARKLHFPLTPKGQYDMLRSVTKTVLQTPDKHGCGVFYWFPESVPVGKQGTWMGGASALFDAKGNALPGIYAFKDAADLAVKKEK